ncbi:MAG: cyclic nucleotide-binding domain-containing protein [Deltaproteobacteria bacterium]|nr:cyclic nucleotide-binding domain-containing protein [Deltaproteobacteria bacterium]MBT6434961.1 cyclic nucleotide-binding domain-containing protein [Deltaproteobacteria bacterium]MBT6491079.1 cyclic nucleotide-binding domain-containing protein [Deltaproteobacteria bacterium]
MDDQITDEELKLFRQFIIAETGIALHSADDFLVLSFLEEFMVQKNLTDVQAVIEWLQSGETEGFVRNWVESLFESPNGFFHDFRDFRFFRHAYVPRLKELRPSRELTIGCIEAGLGQEPYSLSIMINEAIPDLEGWKIKIFATDASESKVHRGRQGVFTDREINRGMPVGLIEKSFDRQEQSWQLLSKHRDMVSFQRADIHGDFKRLPICDIIYMRGVLLYMAGEMKNEILAKVRKRLAPGGCLLIGRGEASLAGTGFKYFQNEFDCSAFWVREEEADTASLPPPKFSGPPKPVKPTNLFGVDDLGEEELAQLTAILRGMSLLKGKNVGEIEALVNGLPVRRYSQGEVLLSQGEPNDVLMGTVSGEVSIWLGTGMFGTPTKVTTLGPGHFIGEQSVFERADCTATVKAENDVTVFEITDELFRHLLDHNTHFSTYIRNLMRNRLAQRNIFRKTGKFPAPKRSQLRAESGELGLREEKRYVLDLETMPKGTKHVEFNEGLVTDFMVFVRRASLMKGLPVDALDALARLVCCVEFPDNTLLIEENEWPNAFYLIHEGQVSVLVGAGYFSRGRIITTLGPGDVVGEMSLMMRGKANASVVTETPVRAYAISRELVDYLYHHNENFQFFIDDIIYERKKK